MADTVYDFSPYVYSEFPIDWWSYCNIYIVDQLFKSDNKAQIIEIISLHFIDYLYKKK